jgi:HTH-type transcriptional regulator / antitoxin HigA
MSDNYEFNPNWASPPGDTIQDILDRKGLTTQDLADLLETELEFLERVMKGEIPIVGLMAKELSEVLGASAEFWEKRSSQYVASVARLEAQKVKS